MATILLDVDGTLIDSYPGIRDSVRWMCDQLGIPQPSEELLHSFIGPPMRESLHKLELGTITLEDAMATYRRHYNQGNWAQVQLYPGWQEVLAQWQAAGIHLFTATSKSEDLAQKTLELVGIAPFFTDIVGADATVGRDSKAKVIGEVLHRHAIDPAIEPILMIGDRSYDRVGAQSFGIDTLLVTWGHGCDAEWQQAQFRADSMDEVKGIVREFFTTTSA
ncbi:MAG: HAD hydrolase-like protein [Corynebacterium sp.]|nr:HAD hydrolase-like protein [Corynebacterium sp.]